MNVRKNLYWAIAVMAAALVETTWLKAISVMDVTPNLTLLLVIYFAIAEGEEQAMLTGALGGVFGWLTGAVVSGIVGLLLGAIVAFVLHKVFKLGHSAEPH